MPRYRMETAIRNLILNRCRRQRMGLHVESAEDFAGRVAQLERRCWNAEKAPAPGHRSGGKVLQVSRAKAIRRKPAVPTVSSGSELDIGPGRDRLIRRPRYETAIASNSRGYRVRWHDSAAQIEADAGRYRRSAERDAAGDLNRDDLQRGEATVDNVHRREDGEHDEYRLTRAWRRGAHGVALIAATIWLPAAFTASTSTWF